LPDGLIELNEHTYASVSPLSITVKGYYARTTCGSQASAAQRKEWGFRYTPPAKKQNTKKSPCAVEGERRDQGEKMRGAAEQHWY
jgi:hypothetical protein